MAARMSGAVFPCACACSANNIANIIAIAILDIRRVADLIAVETWRTSTPLSDRGASVRAAALHVCCAACTPFSGVKLYLF